MLLCSATQAGVDMGDLLTGWESPQRDWIDAVYKRLEQSGLVDRDWLTEWGDRAQDVTLHLREAAEAIVRYTADTRAPAANLGVTQLTALSRLVQQAAAAPPRPGAADRLSVAVDMLIEAAERQNRRTPAAAPTREHVVLLHGLGRGKLSMLRLEQNLINRGYTVSNIDYPSTQHPIEYLAEYSVAPLIAEECPSTAERLHFITHSMGGIVARYLLAKRPPDLPGRVVMLSPPNQGSEVVDLFRDNPLFEALYGPAGRQLGTTAESLPLQLGPVPREVGVITGSRSVDPVFSLLIPGSNDGKVSIARSQLDGMADFLILPHSHTFIMHSPQVIEQALYFLRHGRFQHV